MSSKVHMSVCSGDGLVLGSLTAVENIIIESVETDFNAVLISRRAENLAF